MPIYEGAIIGSAFQHTTSSYFLTWTSPNFTLIKSNKYFPPSSLILVKSLDKLPEGKRPPNMKAVAGAVVDPASVQKQKQIMIRNKNTYDRLLCDGGLS